MTAGFGGSGYTSPQTRALNSIANGGPADTSSQEAMVELLQKHSAQLRYLASNQKQMQQGINDATANPIQQLQQFVADIIVLLGGGELAKGALDFGDLQYILPALGALFGFGDGPFPISLFEAASKFFLGYVVPQEQFVDVINNIITAWAGVFGIDPEFIADVRALVAAVGNLFGGIGNLFPSLNELFEALGITPADLGPLGQILAPIIQLFAGIDLTKFGDFIEFITDAISPFIEQLTALINFINGMLAVLGYDGGDVVNSPIELLLRPFQNLIKFLADLNLFDPDFDLGAAAEAFVNLIIAPLNIFSIPDDVQADINTALGNMKDALNGTYTGSGPIFLAIKALAEAWLTATSPLNAANVFGRFGLGQFGGGVPLNALTAAVSNELEPFRATSELPATEDGDRDGWSFNASEDAAQVVCDGSPKALYLKSGVIKVEEGQPLDTSVSVKYSGVTSGAGQTIRYVLETFTTDDGSGTATPVTVGAVTNPSGTITTPVVVGDSSWDIPPGVKSVRPVLECDELITAGTVFWKNTPELFKELAGPLADGLVPALDNAGQAIRDAIANALGHSGTGHTSANILTYLQNIPKNVVDGLEDFWDAITGKTVNLTAGGLFDAGKLSNVTGTISQSLVTGLTGSLGDLQTTLNQIGDIFNNAVVTPINSVVQSVKDWWNEWFGGGSSNAIPLSQKGAANGVAPLDSSSLIPAQYIPGGVGGGGEPTDHILFTLAGNQSIPSGSATALTGWQQVGSVTATFDDGTNTRWTFPKAGWWDIQSQVVWDTSTTGKRQSAIVRALSSGSVIPATDGADAADCPAWPVRNKIRDTQEVGVRSPLAATDKFSIEAYQNSGAALNAVAGYPDGTYVLATYLGQRQADAVTVMPVAFDARGGGGSVAASGSATTTWSHTATGLDRFVIVFAAFKPSSVTGLNCTASYGGVGMTRVAFLTSSSNAVLAAFIMEDPPTGAKTVSVTASNSSGSVYLIADSLSYTGVGGYTVSNTTLTSSTAMSQSVSSAANRMVAQAFAADGSNGLSAYSQTQRLTASYSSFVRMVAGDAAGAGTVNFTGTSSGGSSKYWGTAIDLQQVSV